ncbi:unnamed protein product [Rhodiola kirilowii]
MASVREMLHQFQKLDKFEGTDFRRWRRKMHFLLTNLKVVYVLSTPCPEVGENAPVGAFRDRNKWENDDYIARGHIINGMSDPLFDLYQNVESAKELWDTLEAKYMAEDASSVKFLVSNFNNYKMVDSRPVMEQFHEIQRILGQFAQRNLKMDEAISVSSIIDKLPPAWKDFRRTLKHKKEDISLVELAKELRMEEELRVREKDAMEVDTNLPKVNVLETSSQKVNKNKGKKRPNEYASKGPNKKHPTKGNVCWTCGKAGHFKRDCRVGKGKSEKAQGNASGNKNQEKFSRMMRFRGGLTPVLRHMCVETKRCSSPLPIQVKEEFFTWEMSRPPLS